ncbi:hypothetical protein BT69DRAFT_1137531 [Atractiella rhizophila]|nr:hypothetical protein BT69DRAFT_1137531 [Atractiella rhizophila]
MDSLNLAMNQIQHSAEPCSATIPSALLFDSTCPFILGAFLSAFGMGILLSEGARYFRNAPSHGHRLIKAMTAIVLFLQFAQTVTDILRVLKIFSLHWGDLGYFITARYEDSISPLLGVLLQSHGQAYLLYRVYVFSKYLLDRNSIWIGRQRKTWKVVLVWTLLLAGVLGILLSTVVGVWMSADIKHLKFLNLLVSNGMFITLGTSWFIISSVVDICISIAMCFELWLSKRDYQYEDKQEGKAEKLINFLMKLTCKLAFWSPPCNSQRSYSGVLTRLQVISHGATSQSCSCRRYTPIPSCSSSSLLSLNVTPCPLRRFPNTPVSTALLLTQGARGVNSVASKRKSTHRGESTPRRRRLLGLRRRLENGE